MKNILLPFLSLAMVLLVGCTEDFAALNEAEVTQPVITSSLDDITFAANFTLRSVGTSSFIIDPKSESISRNNFSVDFSDENYNENGDSYLTSTVTESSSVNGFTLRLTPTQEAIDLVDSHVLKCYININLDDGRVTRYSIDVTLNGDTPLFYDHPESITFPTDFTVDSLQYIEFSVQPGVYEIDTVYLTTSDNSTTSGSNNRNSYYDVLSTEVTDIDSVGTISYMMTIAPSSQAVRMISDSDVEYLLVVRMIYSDSDGNRSYVDSYDFDMVFSSKYESYAFSTDRGVADIVFPENFTNYVSNTSYVGTTYFYVDLGSDGLSVIDNLVLAGSGDEEMDALINYDISTITEVSTTTSLGTYKVTLYAAVNSADIPNGANLTCN
ncbi:MAG: hypothetical protein SNH63_07620, partial [Rikenellaceae bacterium]